MVNTAHIIVSKGVKEELDKERGTLTWNEYLRSLLAPREDGPKPEVVGEVEAKFDRIIGILQERNLPSPAQKRSRVWESVELDYESFAGAVIMATAERDRELAKKVLVEAKDWFRENWEG